MGAGKSHTVRWMWEAGHFPLEAIVHLDPDLFKTAMPEWDGYVALDPMSAEVVMSSLRSIHEQEGLTVLCNLHTLDTARNFCDRVIGMRAGRIVFDGPSTALSKDAVRDIYGAEGELDEAVTSTSLVPPQFGSAPRLVPAASTA